MAQITLNSTGVASNGALVLQSNGTTTAVTISTGQVATLAKDAVVNGLTVGRGAGDVATNTAVGASALAGNSSGARVTAIGHRAGVVNTAGNNAFIGSFAGEANTTGTFNAVLGDAALPANTSGSYNVAVGQGSLNANTTASNNTAVGYQAGYAKTTGSDNTFVGSGAGYSSTTGSGNTVVGAAAGYSLTTGIGNTIIGPSISGIFPSGYYMTTGSKNTIIGSYNGNQGGLDIRTASNYIVLSDGDGNPKGVFDASGNLLVGTTSAIASGSTIQNLGGSRQVLTLKGDSFGSYTQGIWSADTTGDNLFTYFGTETSLTVRGAISYNRTGGLTVYGTTSDYRAKTVNGSIQNALTKVALLKPSTGRMNGAEQDIDFFVAHELQEVVPSAVTGQKDDVKEDGSPNYQMVDKSALIPLLTAAIQEQQALITQLTTRITALEGA